MELGIGTNYVASDRDLALLMVGGARILEAEVVDGALLVGVNVWDSEGNHVARLKRNAWVFNAPGLQVRTSPTHLVLADGDRTLVEVVKPQEGYVLVRRLDVYSQDGLRLLISEENDLDLEVMKGDISMARIRHTAFYGPSFVVRVVDSAESGLAGDGIELARSQVGLQVENCQFGDAF